ncbi:MAG: membrane protein insertion efficiency factor YidD [SAR324 cluster bacterium]|nr:membrane protein insertion efficiency factor YidD [SAR324 cluster bacterium]
MIKTNCSASYFFNYLASALFFLSLLLCLPFLFPNSSFAGMRGPVSLHPAQPKPQQEPSLSTEAAKVGIRFFQVFISPLDGPRSPSYPTGSAYGLLAIKKQGAFWGILLTADRLFHEADQPLGPIINLYGHDRYFDPVSRNDFWLN